MDEDGPSFNVPAVPNTDIDHNLLLQFSCMNTSDKEELIGQLQKLLGPSVNYNTASFFLDMNNWNLQAAVCSYLDYALPPKPPSMSLKAAEAHNEAVPPGSSVEHSWTIANTGMESWPSSCQVVQAGGHQFEAPPVYVPPLPPGQSYTVTVTLTVPTAAGKYRGYFYLLTSRKELIGDTLWVEIMVESELTMALVQQLASLPVPSSRIDECEETSTNPQVHSTDDQMC